MNYWFTADYHLGHFNIIKYCERPFKSLEDMNNTIIRKHNERVKKEDTVFHLGDFCFRNSNNIGEGIKVKAIDWESQLNGKIIHIKGNHDRNNSTKTIIESMIITHCGKRIKLVHRPPEGLVFNEFDCIFVGHVHQNWKYKRIKTQFDYIDLINVGVDVWNFMPHTLEEIMKDYHRKFIHKKGESDGKDLQSM